MLAFRRIYRRARKIEPRPGYQVAFANRINASVNVPVIAVGLITGVDQAETILEKGETDAIALARGVLYDPRCPWHAAAQLGAVVPAPKQIRARSRASSKSFEGGR